MNHRGQNTVRFSLQKDYKHYWKKVKKMVQIDNMQLLQYSY